MAEWTGDSGQSCSRKDSAYVDALEKWSNYSHIWHNSTVYFSSYVCLNVHYERVKETCESAEAKLVFVLGIFGLIGSFLSTLTFFRRPFVPADVYLYRMVGLVETVHMSVMCLMHGLSTYTDCASNRVCMIFSAHFYMTLTNGSADAVEFVVVFLCIERTVACMAPQHFHRIHRLLTYRVIAVLAILTALPFDLVHSFDVRVVPQSEDKYREESTEFADSWLYGRVMEAQLVRFCLAAPLIVLATAGSIVGLNQAARRKRRLRRGDLGDDGRKGGNGRKGANTNNAQSKAMARSRKEIKQMIDLCCLQLCLAVPVVINYLLCVVERICKSGVTDRHKLWEEAFGAMTYDQARSIILRATMLEYLRFSISLTHMLAHGLHFYLYLLFSAKFRQTFGRWLIMRAPYCMGPRWSRDREPIITGEALSTGYDKVKTAGPNSHYQLTVNHVENDTEGKNS